MMVPRRVTRSRNLRCVEAQGASCSGRPDDNQIVRPPQQDCPLEVENVSDKISDVHALTVKPNCATDAGSDTVNNGSGESSEGAQGEPLPEENLSLQCDGSLQPSRVMRCPPYIRSRKNLCPPYSTSQSDASTQPARVMRCPLPSRFRETSSPMECSSTSDAPGGASAHPARVMRCAVPNYPIRKRHSQDEPLIHENEAQAPKVMRCPLPGRSSRTVKCEDKVALPSTSQFQAMKHSPSTSNNLMNCESSVSFFHGSLVPFEGLPLHDSGGTAESEVLKCRSGQSSYPLRALKTVSNYNECQNDSDPFQALKPVSSNNEDQIDGDSLPVWKTILKKNEGQIDGEDTYINRLPNEILCMIFSYLPQLELLRHCSMVCHRWLAVASSPMLWQTLSFCGQDIPIEHVCGSIRFSPMLKSITIKDRIDIDIILPVLQQCCKRLETINLVRCRPSDGVNKSLRAKFLYPFLRKAQLRNLNLKGTDYRSKKFYQILSTMPALKKLNISSSRSVTPQILSEIAMNSNLKVFKNKWHSNSIYNGPKSMTIQLPGKIDDWACAYNLLFQSAGKSLTTLEFYAAGISDSALAALSKCTHLKKLCVYNANCLASESMAGISSLTELQELLLHNAKLTTVDIVHAFQAGNLCGLQCLHLNDSIPLNSDDVSADACVKVVAEKCPKLKHLSITKCCGLTDTGVESVLTHCSELLTLDLNGGLGISGRSFLLIPMRTPQLKLLVVEEDCSQEKNNILKTLIDGHGISVDRISSWKHRTTSYLL